MSFDFIIRFLADFLVVFVVLIAAWALIFKIPKGRRFEAYCRILMAGLTAYLLAKLVSLVYQPTDLRPFERLGLEAGASYLNNPGFPSDHALFVTAIACAVWFETRVKKVGLVLAGLVVLICVGRVLALVHTPLDVIGGVAIALIGALWYSTKPRREEEHGHGKNRPTGSKRHRKAVVGKA
jgi:membrane-associated phospholipid phosphatase